MSKHHAPLQNYTWWLSNCNKNTYEKIFFWLYHRHIVCISVDGIWMKVVTSSYITRMYMKCTRIEIYVYCTICEYNGRQGGIWWLTNSVFDLKFHLSYFIRKSVSLYHIDAILYSKLWLYKMYYTIRQLVSVLFSLFRCGFGLISSQLTFNLVKICIHTIAITEDLLPIYVTRVSPLVYLHRLTLIPACISNYIHYNVWGEITSSGPFY